ncbi:hypothetical protein [uncultured Gilvimarinus sp.]|uniref:hypothetical protein n=1 Tax=uncultured Gilvimarinus sp. TaxID=1689143 RepID=UPI0030ED63A6
MSTNPIQASGTAALNTLTRVLGWLSLPLLLVAVVTAGQQTKVSDGQATLTQLVADLSAIDVNPADGSDNPDHDACALSGTLAISDQDSGTPAQSPRAQARIAARAFAPRAPPVSLHI